jgi:hypothetical protein
MGSKVLIGKGAAGARHCRGGGAAGALETQQGDAPRCTALRRPRPALAHPVPPPPTRAALPGLLPPADGEAAVRVKLLQLPSPPTGAPAQFLLAPGGGGGGALLEVNRVGTEYGAWLVNDRVIPGAARATGAQGAGDWGGLGVGWGGGVGAGVEGPPRGRHGAAPAATHRWTRPPRCAHLPRRPPPDGTCYVCSPVDPGYVLLALLDLQEEQQRAAGGGGGGGGGGMFQEASSLLCIDRCGGRGSRGGGHAWRCSAHRRRTQVRASAHECAQRGFHLSAPPLPPPPPAAGPAQRSWSSSRWTRCRFCATSRALTRTATTASATRGWVGGVEGLGGVGKVGGGGGVATAAGGAASRRHWGLPPQAVAFSTAGCSCRGAPSLPPAPRAPRCWRGCAASCARRSTACAPWRRAALRGCRTTTRAPTRWASWGSTSRRRGWRSSQRTSGSRRQVRARGAASEGGVRSGGEGHCCALAAPGLLTTRMRSPPAGLQSSTPAARSASVAAASSSPGAEDASNPRDKARKVGLHSSTTCRGDEGRGVRAAHFLGRRTSHAPLAPTSMSLNRARPHPRPRSHPPPHLPTSPSPHLLTPPPIPPPPPARWCRSTPRRQRAERPRRGAPRRPRRGWPSRRRAPARSAASSRQGRAYEALWL